MTDVDHILVPYTLFTPMYLADGEQRKRVAPTAECSIAGTALESGCAAAGLVAAGRKAMGDSSSTRNPVAEPHETVREQRDTGWLPHRLPTRVGGPAVEERFGGGTGDAGTVDSRLPYWRRTSGSHSGSSSA